MVYTSPFFKRGVVNNYDPAADGVYEWELTDQALFGVWITVKGDLVQAGVDVADIMGSITSLDVWMGAMNMCHYAHAIDALVMNCKLKNAWPYLVNSSQTVDDVAGVTFPVLFGAPYLNPNMCLPASHSNRKRLVIGMDIATANVDDLLIDIAEVIMPGANPAGAIKQEEIGVAAKGTGDNDVWLQRNWDLFKLNIYSPTVPDGATYTSTIERAGLEIDDVYYGYEGVAWEILHGELMDELEGSGPVDSHIHADPSSGNTGLPVDLEDWIRRYGELDYFFQYDPKWRAPLANSSTAKLKYNAGVDEAWRFATASYVPAKSL